MSNISLVTICASLLLQPGWWKADRAPSDRGQILKEADKKQKFIVHSHQVSGPKLSQLVQNHPNAYAKINLNVPKNIR